MPESLLPLALVPLDERPVNTRYPQMLGAIGGAHVHLPPLEIRGRQRVPCDLDGVAAWLREVAPQCAAVLVSCDFLAFGNLINARISEDSAADALGRLRLLAEINPGCPVHAFSLITRVSNADDAVEEPDYWAQWGTAFYRFARLAHGAERNALSPEERLEMAELEKRLPPDLVADWLTRRLRNHTVNLGLLDMAAREQLTSLLLTSDDTSALGFPSRERDWLRGWPRLVGPKLAARVQMHPGADEVGSALVANVLSEHQGHAPRVWPLYAIADDAGLVAPYEDRPIRETVEGQIRSCGCVVAGSAAESDIVLGVATPSPRLTDYRPEFYEEDRAARTHAYELFLTDLGERQAQGARIALADVAYPNGSDPLLTELLFSLECPLQPAGLCAYGAWNTAGNTLGTVVAQAACSLNIGDDAARALAQRLFLTHRFLEDFGYQAVVRREARAEAERRWGRREPDPDDAAQQTALCLFIEARLSETLTGLQKRGVGAGLKIVRHSVRLPWRRTFEVDFGLAESSEKGQ